MKIKIIEEANNEIKVEFQDDDIHTLPNLIVNEVLKDNSVEFAGYNVPHPLEKKAIIVIRTKRKDPKKVVYDAIENIKKEISNVESALK